MPRLKSIEELRRLREETQRELRVRSQTGTRIIIGMGTCGIAAGARETMRAVLQELTERDIEAQVETAGCVGMCAREPLVDIEQAGRDRVTYGNITSDRVSRLIETHLLRGDVVQEWAVGRGEAETSRLSGPSTED